MAYSVTGYMTSKGQRRYMVRYRRPNGQQTTKRGFPTKRIAETWGADNLVKIAQGNWIDPNLSKVTVGELGDRWMARRRVALKPSAYRPIEAAWTHRVLPRWEHVPIGEITHTEVGDWLSSLTVITRKKDAEPKPLAASGVINAHQVLSGILAEAVRDRRIGANPCQGVPLPAKRKKRKLYLSHQDVQHFAEEVAAGPVDAKARSTLVLTLAYTGIRWGEVTGLRVRGVNVLKRRLVIYENAVAINGKIHEGTTKSNRERTVPVPDFLMEQIEEQIAGKSPHDLVFPDIDGTHLTLPPSSRGWWQQAIKRAELPRFTPHDLRHTAASFAVSAGANVKAVQRMLGHASAAMTLDTYADLFDDDLDDVAERLNQTVVKLWSKQA